MNKTVWNMPIWGHAILWPVWLFLMGFFLYAYIFDPAGVRISVTPTPTSEVSPTATVVSTQPKEVGTGATTSTPTSEVSPTEVGSTPVPSADSPDYLYLEAGLQAKQDDYYSRQCDGMTVWEKEVVIDQYTFQTMYIQMATSDYVVSRIGSKVMAYQKDKTQKSNFWNILDVSNVPVTCQ